MKQVEQITCIIPTPHEAEVEGSQIQGLPEIHREYQTGMGYTTKHAQIYMKVF